MQGTTPRNFSRLCIYDLLNHGASKMHAKHHRSDLVRLSAAVMLDNGLQPEFSDAALRQLAGIWQPAHERNADIRDLTGLLWCSIDNDDSRDLDQLTVCKKLKDGAVRMLVAIADVDALVKRGSAIDKAAWINTTSVYTSARIYPMLPELLSTNLTSLNPGEERLALVTEMTFDTRAVLTRSSHYRARVRNQAKLAYDAVSAWLDGTGELPPSAAVVPGMAEQLRVQDALAQQLRQHRHAEGSLELETLEPRAVFDGERVVDIQQQVHNRARQLIEELMIATNHCTARYLAERGCPSLRRVVRSPERWLRIVAVAAEYGEQLPTEPSAKALEEFLAKRHQTDPLRFPDLSLVVVKLMGSGEYVVEQPGEAPIGHFGLAVRDYTHSTAPNRRYPDLITSRLLKATMASQPAPYSIDELYALAQHCTRQEDAAQKVERRMRKSEAALVLESKVGETFDAIVTGSNSSGVWVRTLTPPVEGKLLYGYEDRRVGDRLHVRLISTNVELGFIDFEAMD